MATGERLRFVDQVKHKATTKSSASDAVTAVTMKESEAWTRKEKRENEREGSLFLFARVKGNKNRPLSLEPTTVRQ